MGQKQADLAGGQPTPAGENHRKRNLANQRNYRNRQKQYVDELEHKLRVYEREGAEATESIQRAARRVHEENAALRRLVHAHLGWSQQEVDSRLLCENPNLHPTTHSGNAPLETHGMYSELGRYSLASPEPTFHGEPAGGFRPAYDAKVEPLPSSSWMRASVPYDRAEIDFPKYGRPDSFDYPPAAAKDSMSCEDAAAILAEFRSQGDLDLIKGELGCAPVPSRSCSVSHRDLFARLADST